MSAVFLYQHAETFAGTTTGRDFPIEYDPAIVHVQRCGARPLKSSVVSRTDRRWSIVRRDQRLHGRKPVGLRVTIKKIPAGRDHYQPNENNVVQNVAHSSGNYTNPNLYEGLTSSLPVECDAKTMRFAIRKQYIALVGLYGAFVPDEPLRFVELIFYDPDDRHSNPRFTGDAFCDFHLRPAPVDNEDARQRPLGMAKAAGQGLSESRD